MNCEMFVQNAVQFCGLFQNVSVLGPYIFLSVHMCC